MALLDLPETCRPNFLIESQPTWFISGFWGHLEPCCNLPHHLCRKAVLFRHPSRSNANGTKVRTIIMVPVISTCSPSAGVGQVYSSVNELNQKTLGFFVLSRCHNIQLWSGFLWFTCSFRAFRPNLKTPVAWSCNTSILLHVKLLYYCIELPVVVL